MMRSYEYLTDGTEITLDGRSVCIVDDDELFRSHLVITLAQTQMRTMEASDSAGLMAALDKEMPDCILLDYNLKAENGFRLYEQLRLRFPELSPVIMISGDETQRTAIKAFRVGLDDFLPKRNLTLEQITTAFKRAISLHDVRIAHRDEMESLRTKSIFDELTGMYSRDELVRKLNRICIPGDRRKADFAIFSIQMAEYAQITYHFGAASGDEALRVFAKTIRDSIRADDFCGRFEDETFYYIIDRPVSDVYLTEFLAKLKRELAMTCNFKSAKVDLSAVIAMALYPHDGNSLQEISAYLAREAQTQRTAVVESRPEDWNIVPGTPAETPAKARVEGRELRRSVHRRTLKPAFIAVEAWSSRISCTVRNISDHGACVRLDGPLALPEYFLLKITETGALRHVRKCWHINNEIGVEFCSQPPE